MTDESEMGPTEARVFAIFREAWADTGLRRDVPPTLPELTGALLSVLGRVEEAIRAVAATVDQASHQGGG
jgi:hypothetical protein